MLPYVVPSAAVLAAALATLAPLVPAEAAPLPPPKQNLAPESPIVAACHRGWRHRSGRPCGYAYRTPYGPPAFGYFSPPAYGYYRGPRYGYGGQVCRWRVDAWGRAIRVCRWR